VECAEGYRWRERQAWERTAWQTAILLQKFGDQITAAQLLGDTPVTDPEAALDALVAGRQDSLTALDRAYQVQAERKANGGH